MTILNLLFLIGASIISILILWSPWFHRYFFGGMRDQQVEG